ncbi:MAG: D-tyrosyl-tRNA(Tyr) deacylase [Oligoflexales bacterium]|nr:D-tyrosyl-tRNA(Tyr) deacylase [Oligoflexales bacterium]
MKAILQRVDDANVSVDNNKICQIGTGWLVLLGVAKTDTENDAAYLAEKTLSLRMFSDSNDKFNLNVMDIKGDILVVSQFTLLADCRKGRRPNFQDAAEPDLGERLYNLYVEKLKSSGLKVVTGIFGARMKVSLINAGPVTITLESERNTYQSVHSAKTQKEES